MSHTGRSGRFAAPLVPLLVLLAAGPAGAAVQLPANFVNEVLVTGLDQPTSMAFIPDGRLLFTEQHTGKIRLVVNGHLAATDQVFVVPDLNGDGYERGLEGIAVDPAWPSRPFVYLHYSRLGGFCRIVRYTATGDLANPLGENLSLTDPLLLIDDISDLTPDHQSGCVRFGPDGNLYVSLGEDEYYCLAADSTTLHGEIIRLKVNGLAPGPGPQVPRALITPADNPLSTPDSNARLVWAYGLRNPWRFQPDPESRLIYASDPGESSVEEINEIAAGDFLGWPWREGNLIMPRTDCPEPGGQGSIAYKHPIVAMSRGSVLTAIVSAGIHRRAPGGAFNWPATYNGDVFYGEYYSGFLWRIRKFGGTWAPAPPDSGQPDDTVWGTGLITAVDFLIGPDGSLWWLRQFDDTMSGVTGSLQRIRYTGALGDAEQSPATGVALAVRPNPSADRTELSFRLAAPAHVRLDVYDLAGRRVRRLVDGALGVGAQRFEWNGDGAGGRKTAPGVYLARLEHGGHVETARVLRVR